METQLTEEMEYVINQYGSHLFRLGILMLKNEEDAKDALQEVLLKYMQKKPDFDTEEYRKAWLIRVYSNECKDFLRRRKRRGEVSFEENTEVLNHLGVEKEKADIIAIMQALPEKYRIVLHLHYIEGYQTEEIAKLLGISPAAARKRLQRSREQLKKEYTA